LVYYSNALSCIADLSERKALKLRAELMHKRIVGEVAHPPYISLVSPSSGHHGDHA